MLTRALTHASRGGEASNERLEFFGDRVLGLIIAEFLYAKYPDEPEGSLAVRLNALVRSEACAKAGTAAGLPDFILMEQAAARRGETQNPVIVGGACEAVIAALYLDGGYETAKRFVLRYWRELLEAPGQELRDPKSRLQELAASGALGKRSEPSYDIVSREGPDHAPSFTVRVTLAGQAPQTGRGASKREAEQAAAQAMLNELAEKLR